MVHEHWGENALGTIPLPHRLTGAGAIRVLYLKGRAKVIDVSDSEVCHSRDAVIGNVGRFRGSEYQATANCVSGLGGDRVAAYVPEIGNSRNVVEWSC